MLELLVPAGNEETANYAIDSGADAIYLGLTAFSARASAENFDEEGLARILRRAHAFGVKVYVAMNISVKNAELNMFLQTAVKAHDMGADAIILQDIFIGKYLHEKYPQMVLHLSTQAGTNNLYGARLAKEYGFSRVILARETPIEEIEEIASFMETEAFIQGALCTCFSGQCYLSGFAGGNSGNRGRCKQPCRKKYSYDRAGYEEKAYALSLADLSVGENIKKYVSAGVVSFKIEGRMRRPEYVAAAVKYYRALLEGSDSRKQLSALKRTYNRNNYTQGLAFGQDKRFLSRDIQGHIGEKVGVVMMRNRRAYCESNFQSRKGDCFKIIRKGKEVGGGVFEEKDGRGFYLSSRARLQNGDGVFVTTDTTLNESLLKGERRLPLTVSARFREGERAVISTESYTFISEEVLQSAKSRPLTKEELKTCLKKSEWYDAAFEEIVVEGNIFIPKSALNEMRRRFYAGVEGAGRKKRAVYAAEAFNAEVPRGENKKVAVISDTSVPCDIFIFKPKDYADEKAYGILSEVKAEKYLYLPPFLSQKDMRLFEDKLSLFDGVYAECFWGIAYAREKGKALFAGTGFNLMNALSVSSLQGVAKYYAISKELDNAELRELCAQNAFSLSAGNIKVMDLIYCPFEKTCDKCDRRERYSLTDENDRVFPVRRYLLSSCRFEVYNCAPLVSDAKDAGKLVDLSLIENKKEVLKNIFDPLALKKIFKNYTFGHSDKTVL